MSSNCMAVLPCVPREWESVFRMGSDVFANPPAMCQTMAQVRPACLADVPALAHIEGACFASDRLARRQFRYLLTRGHALVLVAWVEARIQGYGLLLLRSNSCSARLYSLAIHPARRRMGLGQMVLCALEGAAVAQGLTSIHLEVRTDNASAIAFYQGLGYRPFATCADYYADHQDACRMRKRLDTK
ncbi:MAG: GNAT family N-acetyltransferase [Magnetococcales bacterium]|nr:GNAT family N-acetyltransferase [Magnetococcales bacterium]